MYKIAVLGDKDSVFGFKALGLDVFPCNSENAKDLLLKISKEDYAIIYITEQLALNLKTEIDKFKDDIKPAVILIPSKEGSLGVGIDNVRLCVERAVGADILDN